MSKRANREYKRKSYDEVSDEFVPNHELKIRKITPKNEAQAHYMRKINGTSITFGVGPAGTGKTWLAAVMAAQALKNGQIDKIVVTRPAIEVGKGLGFLPGEMEEKYEPYFRPVRDAFEDALGVSQTEYYIKAKKIEARPLEYLRGSTLGNSWVIADEMQNATPVQMKMFLTRFGEGGKFIINGDIRQQDIPGKSGLQDALERLRGLSDIAICEFSAEDIVRSGLVRHIIDRYENNEKGGEFPEGLKRFLGD